MDNRGFWDIIDKLKGWSVDARAARLEDVLALHEGADIVDFADHLAESLHKLDTPAHSAAAGHIGGDAFLYARCAVVMKGRETFARAVNDASILKKFRNADAEPLLYVAERAYERATEMAWEHESPVSYESGTSAAWNLAVDRTAPDTSAPLWLSFAMGTSVPVVLTPEYEVTTLLVPEILNQDPEWNSWWQTSQTERLDAILVLDPEENESTEVKKGRKLIRVELCRKARGFQSAEEASEVQKACDDIHATLLAVQEAASLPPLPAFPEPPALPRDLLQMQRQSHQQNL